MYEEKFRETTSDSTREQLLPRPRGVSFRGKVGVVSHPKSHPTWGGGGVGDSIGAGLTALPIHQK